MFLPLLSLSRILPAVMLRCGISNLLTYNSLERTPRWSGHRVPRLRPRLRESKLRFRQLVGGAAQLTIVRQLPEIGDQTTLQHNLIKVAKEILESKYPDAAVLFLAGSIVRGEATPYSDFDLVVIFERLPHAYRESFRFQGFPVEAFVHDPETLNYFLCEVDRPSGIPSLAQMILEGIELPVPNELSQSVKQLAASMMEAGPPAWSDEEVQKARYNLTSLVDDLREPRSRDELLASGTELYEALADYYFRSHNRWSAKGKSIPRILKQADTDLCWRFCNSFDELWITGQSGKVIALVEELLKPNGGFLFEGHRLDAPKDYKKPLAETNRAAEQIVGRERRERFSRLDSSGDA